MTSRVGFVHGTGAALNVELGWIPDFVMVVNLTDGDDIWANFLGPVTAFTSGGTTEIKKGDEIVGLTSGATAKVREVILDSGSWAGGDAAGWLILDVETIVGTFVGEGAGVNGGTTDFATLSAVHDEDGIDIDDAVAPTTTAATQLTSYKGDASNGYAKGFTIGSTVSENAKLIGYLAIKNSPGEGQTPKVAGNTQAEAVW